ncbi:Flp family type IVb pilin [Terricaulis silvestris]|uniref:Flp pilus assembly protein, pilin Flp n=1 Tax=Terricaulis silvestris TaxID=2686094 RepID=A0A6I6MP11_9CAUL|nr:Flp family type IVb pilin [Terricaulis silvestris]QGZ96439.1 Flp pilus assembly protein, pilin Flp [Terricaulis silvestris]
MIKRFLTDENGTTSIEYAVIAGLIAMVVIVTVGLIGEEVGAVFTNVAAGFPDA